MTGTNLLRVKSITPMVRTVGLRVPLSRHGGLTISKLRKKSMMITACSQSTNVMERLAMWIAWLHLMTTITQERFE